MNTFSFKTAFKQSMLFTISNIGALFKSAILFIVLYGAVKYLTYTKIPSQADNDLGILIGILLELLLLMMFSVAWGGFYLKKVNTISFADVSNWHSIKTAYLITTIKLSFITLILMIVLNLPLVIMNGYYNGINEMLSIAMFIASNIAVFAIISRLSVVLGYCISTGKTNISHIWNITRSNTIKLALSYFALGLPILIVTMVIILPIAKLPELYAIINSILMFIINAILTVYHVNVYQQLTK